MRAPSLYVYFDSKAALYDAMFADGYRALHAQIAKHRSPDDSRAALRAAARLFVTFAVEDPARFQLLFQRTIPGFEPSPESFALAEQALARTAEVLGPVGLTSATDLDLWTALVTGLASQQISNDPGGSRWVSLVDEAVDRLLR
jgi:AcrR family transcriptional regulator